MFILILTLLATVVIYVNADSELNDPKNNWRRVQNTESLKEIDDEDSSGVGVSYRHRVRSKIENEEEELNAITYFKDNKKISKPKPKEKSQNKRLNVNEQANYKDLKTTCEEFGENSYFHPKEIFYKTWASFYKWTTHVPNGYIMKFNFTIPERKLIYKLKEMYQLYSKDHISWKLPKFSMMMNNEHFVIIASDKNGGFDILIDHTKDSTPRKTLYNIRVPKMRMKIVGPYLVIMFCGYPSAMVYACLPEGHFPLFIKEAVSSIGIVGGYGIATRFTSSDFGNNLK